MKDKILKIALKVIEEIKGRNIIKKVITKKKDTLKIGERTYPLRPVKVIAVGKASIEMTKGIIDEIGGLIEEALVISPYYEELQGAEVILGSHPYPDERSLRAGEKLQEFAARIKEGDLVIFLISGGASALAEVPLKPFSIKDIKTITRGLLKAGADIEEINTVRRHLSAIKGGRLAEKIFPAELITIAISDVKFDVPYDIGSGPTVGDPTTVLQAANLLLKYGFEEYAKIVKKLPETPKPGDNIFKNTHFYIAANTLYALSIAKKEAGKEGIRTLLLTAEDEGEAREVAKIYSAVMHEIKRSHNPASPPILLLSGGELTVTVKGEGKGGRNTELVLAMLLELKKFQGDFVVLSIGTDGQDGPTDAAGAFFNKEIYEKIGDSSPEDYLNNNDSYSFFEKVGGLIFTGPTGTNVRDIRFFYVQ